MLPAPTAPSEGSAGVRNLVDRSFRPIYPLSILAHQLRRRFPSCSALLRGARLFYSTAPPEGSLVFRPARPGTPEISDPKTEPLSGPKPPDVLRPFLGKPLLRPASLTEIPKNSRNRVAREATSSSGASSRLAPLPLPKEPWQCLPAEIGPLVTCRTACRCRLLTRPGPPSRSHEHHAHRFRVAEAKFSVTSLWITGISGTTVGTISNRSVRLPFRSRSLTSAKCLNYLH